MLRGRFGLISVPGNLVTRVVSAVARYVPVGMPVESDLKNIHELLDAEAVFAKRTPEILKPFAPQLLDAFNDAMGMYATFGRIIGQNSPVGSIQRRFDEYARQLGAADRGQLEEMRTVRPRATAEEEALLQELQTLEDQAEAWLVRGVVFTQVARAFAWSVADMMRMRITTAIGLQRLVAEGFGLACLMREDPAIAIAWRQVVTDDDGIVFYRAHQKRLLDVLQKAGLLSTYERASGLSMHLRFAGAAHGLAFEKRQDGVRRETSTVMLYQELRPETAFSFIVSAVNILDPQATVFSGLTSAFPEVDEAIWTGSRVPAFRNAVAALWQRFRTAFPDKIARLEKKYGPLRALGSGV